MIPAQDPFAAYQPSAEPDQSFSEEKTSTNRKVAVLVGGTTLVGASLAGLAWGLSRSNPDETNVTDAVRDDDLRIDKEGAIRTIPDSAAVSESQSPIANLTVSDVVTDADNDTSQTFSDAFRAARAEVGAGKFFTWHGNLYSTNYKEEWEAKPEADQKTYFADMGLAEADFSPEPVDVPIEEDVLPEPPVAASVEEPHSTQAEPEDGIPVSIEELKNAEFSSDKITIVDAISIQDKSDEVPLPVQQADDQSGDHEWIQHDAGTFMNSSDFDISQFNMPQYDSSMTDDLSDDDGQNAD